MKLFKTINVIKMNLEQAMDFLAGLKMTIIAGIFLLIAVIFMILHISVPIWMDPAWGL